MRLCKVASMMIVLLGGVTLVSRAVAKDPEVLPTPMMRAVNPDSAKAGEIVTVSGEHLDKSRVADLFLTNGQKDVKVEIVEQTATSIKFKVPNSVAAGRYNLLVLLVDIEPKLIEEPVRLTVE